MTEIVDQLTKEWREHVNKKLDSIDDRQRDMTDKLAELRNTLASDHDLNHLADRVRILEDFRLRTITVLVAVQFLLMGIWALLVHFVFK